MENTLTLFEDDTKKCWYTVVEGSIKGPLSAKEIAESVLPGSLSVAAFVWQEEMEGWKRIYEIEKFHSLLPQEPSGNLLDKLKEELKTEVPMPPQPEMRTWYTYMNGAQYGPFSKSEMEMMLDSGRIASDSYLWKKGMPDWQFANLVEEWKDYFTVDEPQPAPTTTKKQAKTKEAESKVDTEPKDKRHAPRKPFEAKILLTDGKEVGWALCRDISVGGMQVLMDTVPGGIGTDLKLNVNGANGIPGFACEGKIVRILEDNRGFSFVFTNLPEVAKSAIQNYT